MTNIAFNAHISSLLKIRYSLTLAILPLSLMFASFIPMWLLISWLELDTDTPLKELEYGYLMLCLFLGGMVLLMISGYLIGWLLNALISKIAFGWTKEKICDVYLNSEVPDEWLKNNQSIKEAFSNKMNNWKEQREKGVLLYVLQTGVLGWGLIMFFIMAVLPAIRSSSPIEVSSLVSQAVIWAIGGALFGYIRWFFYEKQYQKFVDETYIGEQHAQKNVVTKQDGNKMDKNKWISALVVFGAIGGAILGQQAVISFSDSSEEKIAKMLLKASNETNANLPVNVDSETILMSTTAHQDTFTYVYRLPNHDKENIDVIAFVDAMTPNLKNSVCTTESMQAFRNLEVIVAYSYYDKNQKQFAEIKVDTKECSTIG